ncbi:interferon regulatory factor 4 [Triplophysa dalaica]|uniref:interferon regulatory factor 4 n=1 Tax=Triplophysa dalaica TaxID=1582913 RepID=UPI0024DF6F7E|nr:interferon regulatory factor 4 [Triplophysa dalaica]
MSVSSGNGKLRRWLIEQVETGKYPGLVWVDRDRTTFRIPWKHAGKQDYNRDEDAALFKAWALFKGKYREGIDKPDPPTWKTRLRCALNKSCDFEEVVGQSQLDISEPFKVYRVIPEGTKRVSGAKCHERVCPASGHHSYPSHPSYEPMHAQLSNFLSVADRNWRDFLLEQNPLSEMHSSFGPSTHWDAGYQISGSFYSSASFDSPSPLFSLDPGIRSLETMTLSESRLQVSVFSGDVVFVDVTVTSMEGCLLLPHDDSWTHMGAGGPEAVPLPHSERGELEGGVLLWMSPDGLYARRFCQSAIYCDTTQNNITSKLCKLERDQTSKLLDTQLFLTDLQTCFLQACPPPRFHVQLFFDSCGPSADRRPLTVQVEPLLGRQLLMLMQQGAFGYSRNTHDLSPLTPDQILPINQDYPVTHSGIIQESFKAQPEDS